MENSTVTLKKSTVIGMALFIVILGGYFLFFNAGGVPTGNVVGADSDGVYRIKTTIQNFKYNPETITVKEGSLVELTIENKDSVVHGLHLPQFNLIGSTPPGIKTFTFTALVTPTNGQAVPTCSQEHGEILIINVF